MYIHSTDYAENVPYVNFIVKDNLNLTCYYQNCYEN